ncbi:polysaccharide deacetylase family sporulation protein PdaB [Paenibacillus algorifonticola]|uniref:Polysaccharide deacetylase family sporulation protein PdaB n=1 Tax=Paenibacillus algorifonticola TaxID=684063 RepID=A0A1I1ZPU9_9BACL|nr:polysaccharide deacetylase family protein [Paenibacillus algorifonticola]SFE33662.1 polysaccharide deacetylase family sporulation protein PdaB [Paenibacillus algorifonticola]
MKPLFEAVYRVNTKKKRIALTFDIGWGSRVPAPVLDALSANKVNKATFFLSSPWVLKHPRLARKIKTMGYEIGSHGQLHENYTEHSNRWITREVKSAGSAIRRATGVKCQLIRTPNGDMNHRVTRLLGSLGYYTIHWSVDSMDWTNPGVRTIIRNSTLNVKPGDILLLHASDSARQTAKALPFIIRKLRRKGFDFVTVSELLSMGAR